MRPSIHDHSLIEYRVNLLESRVTLITRPPAENSNSARGWVATMFEGLEAHHFERVSSGAILLDIEEPPLADFLQSHEHEFAEGHRRDGAPSWWRGTAAAAEDYLRERGARAFEIASSYGFAGWILAAHVHQSLWSAGGP